MTQTKPHPAAPKHFTIVTDELKSDIILNDFNDVQGKEFRFNIKINVGNYVGLVGNIPFLGNTIDGLSLHGDNLHSNVIEAFKRYIHMEFFMHECKTHVSTGNWQFAVCPAIDGAYIGTPVSSDRYDRRLWKIRAIKASTAASHEGDRLLSFFRNKKHDPFFERVPNNMNCFAEVIQPIRAAGLTIKRGSVVSIIVKKNEQPTVSVCIEKHSDSISKLSNNARVAYASDFEWMNVHPADIAPFSIIKRDDVYLEIRWVVSGQKELVRLVP